MIAETLETQDIKGEEGSIYHDDIRFDYYRLMSMERNGFGIDKYLMTLEMGKISEDFLLMSIKKINQHLN